MTLLYCLNIVATGYALKIEYGRRQPDILLVSAILRFYYTLTLLLQYETLSVCVEFTLLNSPKFFSCLCLKE